MYAKKGMSYEGVQVKVEEIEYQGGEWVKVFPSRLQ